MPKSHKTRNNRSQAAANQTGPGRPTSGAGQSQIMSANNLTIINYTAMPTETLRFMLSQRHLNQTGPRRVLITRLWESDSPATNTAPQVPKQLSAMITSIVEAKLANLNSSSTSGSVIPPEIEPAQASPIQPTLTGVQISFQSTSHQSCPLFLLRGPSMADKMADLCSVALSSCVADMSNTFWPIVCVVVSSNENALWLCPLRLFY